MQSNNENHFAVGDFKAFSFDKEVGFCFFPVFSVFFVSEGYVVFRKMMRIFSKVWMLLFGFVYTMMEKMMNLLLDDVDAGCKRKLFCSFFFLMDQIDLHFCYVTVSLIFI
ncbi:unnamed protein product [Vicia faba]|uniref:Transmembrane protein n=1 Tax=Vicia faba TaxID=3906 RepID=A0AAV1A5U9_VICFA|nr:unnamed protein product [Vicia faba]